MYNISKRWIKNRESRIQAQAVTIITITDGEASEVLSSAELQNFIKSVTHSRSFDPMNFELPKNNAEVKLYNYGGRFDGLVKRYIGQPVTVKLEYGYIFGTDTETIPGGLFYVDDNGITVENDNVITIKCVSSLALLPDNVTVQSAGGVVEESLHIWDIGEYTEAEKAAVYGSFAVNRSDFFTYPTQRKVNASGIFDAVQNAVGLDFSVDDKLYNSEIPVGETIKLPATHLIQCLSNALQCVFRIGRKNNLLFTEKTHISGETISPSKEKDRSVGYMSKNIKRVNYNEISWGIDGKEVKTETLSGYTAGSTNLFTVSDKTWDFDFANKNIVSVSTVVSEDSYTKSAIYSIDMTSPSSIKMQFGRNRLSPIDIAVNYVDVQGASPVQINYDDYGDECSIDNPLAMPLDMDVFHKYFLNRSMAELTVIGDPARDVGDIVYCKKDGVYKKALILASELTFNGAFSEVLTVRIIENDYGGIEGDCTDLKYFTVTDGVLTEFDYAAFRADSLTEVTLPDGITEIADGVFKDCMELTEITLPPSVVKIGAQAFEGCSGITSFEIPDSVTEISTAAFNGCLSLAELSLSESVAEIPPLFAANTSLKEITIGDNVAHIGEEAFKGNAELKMVRLGNGIQSIGINAFNGCGIQSVIIPSGVSALKSSFAECAELARIFLNPGITSIGANAFTGFARGMRVFIPPTVTEIDTNAFGDFFDETMTIYGFPGSRAESFAEEKNIKFINAKTTIMN